MIRRVHLQSWKRWAMWLVPGLLVFSTTVAGPLAMPRWVNEVVLFWFVMVITVLCATGAVIVIVVGWRRRLAEVAVLGAVLWSTSTLPMVHGLTTPGVLYEAHHAAFELAAFVAVPIGLVVGLPVLFAGTPVGRALGTVWRPWVTISVTLVSAVAFALLIEPDAIAAPSVRSPIALAGIAVSIGGTLVLSFRHLRLYRIGRRPASLATSVGFVYLGLSSLAFIVETTWSFAFWAAHVADAVGVFAPLFGLYFAHRHDRTLAVLLAPVVNRDPVIALELGLTPVVHDFVTELERRDPSTRDHVVRVGELAARTAARAGLAPDEIRAIGLGALLHDVGKLCTPLDLLTKPGRLDHREFEIMKRHAEIGAAMVAPWRILAPAAPIVRSHHERVDGTGYPDGLSGRDVALAVSIVSVCDAWDAMTNNRHYRDGLGPDRAREILLDGAGRQWRDDAVGLVLDEIDAAGPVDTPAFEYLGNRHRPSVDEPAEPVGICDDAIPAGVLVDTAGSSQAVTN